MKKRHKIILTFGIFGATALSAPICGYAQDEYWHQRVTLFEKLPVSPEDIVFLGNSITDGGEFQELFGMDNVLNRGIRSDRISGVLKRLDQVTSGKPKMIFLLIGINDVADNRNTASSIALKYEELVKEIRKRSPESRLFIQSVMPINNDFRRYKSLIGREGIIPPLNEKLKDIALDNGAVFIDLWPVLSDSATGKMQRQFTNDGLHLTGAGYRAWTDAVRPYVEGIIGGNEPSQGSAGEADEDYTEEGSSGETDMPTTEENGTLPIKRIER
ncbi:MAG: hypothetical protein HDR80_00245 [Bacteroides sp.]|nr:hypothetical protein [Bacteroides sp.]